MTGFDDVVTAESVNGEVTVEFASGEQTVTVRSVVLGVHDPPPPPPEEIVKLMTA
jgi:hypothetical protein